MNPTRSPWGTVQHVTPYSDGIVFVSTASHGGYKLDRKQNAKIPAPFRKLGGWYEEDCEYAIVYWFLPSDKITAKHKEDAKRTILNHFPTAWETHYNVVIPLADSFDKRERQFWKDNENNFVVFSAMEVNGRIETYARKTSTKEEKRFLVPDDEYRQRNFFGFVIDESRHPVM